MTASARVSHRPTVTLRGGPLDQVQVRVDRGARTIRIPAAGGRYVHDQHEDVWFWEQEAARGA